MGELLGSHPRRSLDEGLVENCAFLHCPNGFHVNRRSGEIRKRQDRTARLDSHVVGNVPGNLFDLAGWAVREVDQQNLFTLMSDEPDTLIHGGSLRENCDSLLSALNTPDRVVLRSRSGCSGIRTTASCITTSDSSIAAEHTK